MNEYQYKEEGYKIIGCCYEVYNTLKAGMLEAIYHQALCVEFDIQGVPYECEKPLQLYYKGYLLPKKYFADLVCYDNIIVEVKAVSSLAGEHVSQLLNYMHITESKVGYLVNFGNKDKFEWKRLVL